MELGDRAIAADYSSQAFFVADIGQANGPQPLRPKGDPTGLASLNEHTSFATLREHDAALRDAFLSGWSTDKAAAAQAPNSRGSGQDGYSLLLSEPTEGGTGQGKPIGRFLRNAWASLGVVYGDIGTSPIYTIASILSYTTSPSAADVKGAVSLIIWSLVLIVVFKYLLLVLETDYHGKGGIFALISVLFPIAQRPLLRELLVFFACFAFACMIGDGAMTPAISVVSAVAGVLIPAPQLGIAFVIPVSMLILLLLLFYQRWGTAIIGYSFSPIILLWFISLAGFGIAWIVQAPQIFEALNPWLAIDFIIRNQVSGWLNLANVLLAVTGSEALYADRGHFGANAIRLSWFTVAFPALCLNYIGQGALLLVNPSQVAAPFFSMLQGPLYWPVFILTIFATVIASQAMLSGMFSLVQQALALDVTPRMKLVQTSIVEEGQVYVPAMNVLLGLLCLGIIAGFQTSAALGNAYGFNISMIMFETSILFCFILYHVWKWWIPTIVAVMGPVMLLELGFLTAAFSKVPAGAWFTLTVAVVFTTLFYIWHRGRVAMNRVVAASYLDIEEWARHEAIARVPGRSFFFAPLPVGIPPLITTYAAHVHALPMQIIITTVRRARIPHVARHEAYVVEHVVPGMWRLVITLGFRQQLDFGQIMSDLEAAGLPSKPGGSSDVSFVFGVPHVSAKAGSTWYHRLMLWAFAPMQDLQYPLSREFAVPPNQTLSLGYEMKC